MHPPVPENYFDGECISAGGINLKDVKDTSKKLGKKDEYKRFFCIDGAIHELTYIKNKKCENKVKTYKIDFLY